MMKLWWIAAHAALPLVAPGLWQIQTLVQGSSLPSIALRCLSGGDWPLAILPSAITVGCDAGGGGDRACRGGGRLSIDGNATRERFDLVARRNGPIIGQPRAVALLHIEGRRIGRACPSTNR